MAYLDAFEKSIEEAGYEIFWQGEAAPDQIQRLEALLGVSLPEDFAQFLGAYGGGGVVGAEISGIENNDATIAFGGTVWGDTLVCRKRYGLPDHLVVIFFQENEVCWCIDTSRGGIVVSYSLFQERVENKMADNFDIFVRKHLLSYSRTH